MWFSMRGACCPEMLATVSYLREILGTGHTGEGTFLFYPCQGYLQVIVVLQRLPE